MSNEPTTTEAITYPQAHAADPTRAGKKNRQDHLPGVGAFQHHQHRDNGG